MRQVSSRWQSPLYDVEGLDVGSQSAELPSSSTTPPSIVPGTVGRYVAPIVVGGGDLRGRCDGLREPRALRRATGDEPRWRTRSQDSHTPEPPASANIMCMRTLGDREACR
jgi:hypothetical protein